MTTIIRIAIPDEAVAKLAELARRDLRGTREQAAVLLIEAIERASFHGSEFRREQIAKAWERQLASLGRDAYWLNTCFRMSMVMRRAGIDPEAASAMSDRELLDLPGFGKAYLQGLRMLIPAEPDAH